MSYLIKKYLYFKRDLLVLKLAKTVSSLEEDYQLGEDELSTIINVKQITGYTGVLSILGFYECMRYKSYLSCFTFLYILFVSSAVCFAYEEYLEKLRSKLERLVKNRCNA